MLRQRRQKNYVNRLAVALADGFCNFGGCRTHFDGTFLGGGGLVRRVLLDGTFCPGSKKQWGMMN